MAKRYGYWTVLDIDPTHDERAIKRAYAAKLKRIDVGADPKAFIALRAAFEGAREAAKWMEPPQISDEPADSVSPEQSLAEDDLNPKNRALRYVPMGKLPDKRLSSPRKKVRVKPADVTFGDASEGTIPPKTRLRPKQKKAASTDQDPTENLQTEPKIRFKPEPKTSPEEFERDAFRLHEQPIWYHADHDTQGVEAIIARIMRLIDGDDSKPVDEAALEDAFRQLLAAPELDNIGLRDAIETRIANIAINARGHRGHFLVLLAHWHFGWHEREDDYDLAWPINEVVALAPAITRLRDLEAGGRRSTWDDRKTYHWLIEGPPPRWNPLYWTRRAQISKFIQKTRTETPAFFALIDRDQVAAWQQGEVTGSRLLILLVALVYGTFQWASGFAAALGPNFPLPIWLVTLSFAAIVFGGVVATELAAIVRDRERLFDYGRDRHNQMQFLALAALGSLTLIAGLLPPSGWLAILSVPLAMILFFFTGNPILRLPQRDRSFVVARRMTIGAFFIILVPTMEISPSLYLQIVVPAIFFLWAAARMQESLQLWFEEARLQRWMLHLILMLGAIGALYLYPVLIPTAKSPPPYWYVYTAMFLAVAHDLITPRDTEIPGTKFLILPILTLAMAVLFPIPIMMAVIILRTAPALYLAFNGRRAAISDGRTWYDHGGGYSSGTTFGDITFFGKSSRNQDGKPSIWFWVWVVIVVLQVVRLLANLGGSVAEPEMMKTPEVRENVYEEYLKKNPPFDPKTGKLRPDLQKIMDDIEREKQAMKEQQAPMAPSLANPREYPPNEPPRQ
jgi:hypothetical protein